VPGGANNARRAIGVGVAKDGLEQKEKLLGQHGGSPVTKSVTNNLGKLRRLIVGACDPDHISDAVF
jgi:hypothetical protein